MFNHILTAVDGSPHSKRAVGLAARMANLSASKLLTVCHVIGAGPVPAELAHMVRVEDLVRDKRPAGFQNVGNILGNLATAQSDGPMEEFSYEARRAVSRRILSDASKIATQLEAPAVETVSLEGEPVPQILELANKLNADLIVVGSRGLSDLKGLLMGSVSHKLCQLARCPCLTVR